jgi:hypothetical protein
MSHNKEEWRNIIIFFIILIIIIFIFVIDNSKDDYDNYKEQIKDEFSNVQELHWTHIPVTYSFAEPNTFTDIHGLPNYKCPDFQIDRLKNAFDEIQNETDNIILFKEVDYSTEITVYCYRLKAEGGYYILGEGGYESDGNRIINGTLNFYDHLNCGTWPDAEIHEILHMFGYDHIDKWDSIMSPLQKTCDLGKIDDEIVNDLMIKYSK